MGGGAMWAAAKLTGVMRAATKLTGVTVATGGIRGVTAEHLPISSSKRGSFSVRAAATTISSEEETKLVSSLSQNSCSEIDDWTGGEEKVIMCAGEPMPRVVFGGAPTLQEAKEATSELSVTLEKAYLLCRDTVGYGNSVAKHDLGSPALTSPAVKAFRLLHESPAAQNVVASLASDLNVWTAALQNPELQEFMQSQKTKGLGLIDSVTGAADHLEKLSAKSTEDSSSNAESGPANSFVGFFQKMKVTFVDIKNNLSDYFRNFFGGKGAKVFASGDGTPRSSTENVMGASFIGLAVMAIVVILFKRGSRG